MRPFQQFKNYKNSENCSAKTSNLDKPSLSTKSQNKIDQCVSVYNKKKNEFISLYATQGLDSLRPTTTRIQLSNTQSQQIEDFEVIHIGTFALGNKTWTWEWLDDDNQLKSNSPLIEIRNYGYHHQIETLIKHRWIASKKDVLEMCAVSLLLKSGTGILEQEHDKGVNYYLVKK